MENDETKVEFTKDQAEHIVEDSLHLLSSMERHYARHGEYSLVAVIATAIGKLAVEGGADVRLYNGKYGDEERERWTIAFTSHHKQGFFEELHDLIDVYYDSEAAGTETSTETRH